MGMGRGLERLGHDSDHYDYIVLGAGVAGLVAAHRLAAEGRGRILVVDEYDAPGGNQVSRNIGDYSFDIGAFYYPQNAQFFRLFPQCLEPCLSARIPISRVTPKGQVVGYPVAFRDDLLMRGPWFWARALWSMGQSRLQGRAFASAEDYARYYAGDFLYRELGLQIYMQRFYGVAPSDIDVKFAEARMQAVRRLGSPAEWYASGVAKYRKKRSGVARPPQRPPVVRPLEGFGRMYWPAVEQLQASGVEFRFGVELRRLTKRREQWHLEAQGCSYRAAALVNTIPVRRISELLGLSLAQGLHTSDLQSLYFSFAGDRRFSAAILYNFSPCGEWKRLTMHSDHYGMRGGRAYFSVEVPVFKRQVSAAALAEDFCKSVRRYGLFAGDLELEGDDYLQHAYPALVRGSHGAVQRARRALTELGVISVGRQGYFEYLPTGPQVVAQVRSLMADALPSPGQEASGVVSSQSRGLAVVPDPRQVTGSQVVAPVASQVVTQGALQVVASGEPQVVAPGEPQVVASGEPQVAPSVVMSSK